MTTIEKLSKLKQSPTLKLATLIFLALLFLIPLAMVNDVIRDRIYYKDQALQTIEQGWASSQTITGPILVIPYIEKSEIKKIDPITRETTIKYNSRQKYKYILPENLDIKTEIEIEERYKGIYKIPVYTANINLTGNYAEINDFINSHKSSKHIIQTPYISIGTSDIRGISGQFDIQINKQKIISEINPGTKLSNFPNGIHIKIDKSLLKNSDFKISAQIKGTKSLNITPIGKNVEINMSAPWPHPDFNGKFLPTSYSIDENNFTAQWKTGHLATNLGQLFNNCIKNNNCYNLNETNLGVSLFQSVDIYQQSMRTAKYGILFISLTFGIFFIFEIMKKMRIHPIQYTMVGASLALFYMSLTSMSEHMPFIYAYILSTLTTTSLLGYYISNILKNRKEGIFMASLITILYGVIYTIILSEDHALLMGSTLLFSVLALAMHATRKVNWYDIGGK